MVDVGDDAEISYVRCVHLLNCGLALMHEMRSAARSAISCQMVHQKTPQSQGPDSLAVPAVPGSAYDERSRYGFRAEMKEQLPDH